MYTGVPVSVLVPLPGPPLRDSRSVLTHYPYRLTYLYFLGTNKWVDLAIGSTDSRIRTSTVTRTPLTWFTIRTDSLSVYFLSTDKWVDLGIGSTDSGTPVYVRISRNKWLISISIFSLFRLEEFVTAIEDGRELRFCHVYLTNPSRDYRRIRLYCLQLLVTTNESSYCIVKSPIPSLEINASIPTCWGLVLHISE